MLFECDTLQHESSLNMILYNMKRSLNVILYNMKRSLNGILYNMKGL